jgi:hypothetical protein
VTNGPSILFLTWAALLGLLLPTTAALSLDPQPRRDGERVVFSDDFERGLDRWDVIGENAVALRPSGDPRHGSVLQLTPNGDVAAVIRGSEAWGRVRLEGEMLFPSNENNYLGFVYNFMTRGARRDFGLIYVKGNESYLQVNPHRDFNVSRTIYPELRASLTGVSAVETGVWQRFALEVDGATAHLYVGQTSTPQVTFSGFEFDHGALGLQPRSVGDPVWVDNVTVRTLTRLSYDGPPIPAPEYAPAQLLTHWQVAGPFAQTDDRIARTPEALFARWSPFQPDARGAVVTNRIVDYHGSATVAYLRTSVESGTGGPGELQISTADDLAVWLNGEFQAFVPRQDAAWYDFSTNAAHQGRRAPVTLRAGANVVVIRVRGGVYASGGFFARLLRVP